MNYFEFYELPESFFPDEKKLKAKFYEFSRKYHPDFHATASAEKQREILELSTLNTNAYKTLGDPESRMAYILKSHGLLEEGAKNELPADFLMEMMDLNERLMELEFDFEPEALSSLQADFDSVWQGLEGEIAPLLLQYERLPEGEKANALQAVKIYYLKRKYLLRIKETLATFANRS